MKRIVVVLATAFLVCITGSAISAEISHQEAYACRVEARKCMDDIQVVQAKVQKISEAAAGGTVYSPTDIDKLQKLIKELNDTLDKIEPVK